LNILQQAMQGNAAWFIYFCLYMICSSIGIWLAELTSLPGYLRGAIVWACGIYSQHLAVQWGVL